MRRLTMKWLAIVSVAALAACGGGEGGDNGGDTGADTGIDGGGDVGIDGGDPDGGTPDGGTPDGGDRDGGDPDGGTDGGDPDGGDGGDPDGGTDGGTDGGDPDGGTDGGDPDSGAEICDDEIDNDGDGDVDCDDADCDGDDACPAGPVCGDGTIDTGEACDDGTLNSDDDPNACRTTCVEPSCGDGVTDDLYDETCDDGNTDDGDGCDATCQLEPFCGNGVIDGDEACDDGVENSDRIPNACRTDCSLPSCGDSVTDAGEQCDDGNNDDGDGCNAVCAIEIGEACADVVDLAVLADVGTPAGDGIRYQGTLTGTTPEFAPPGDCVEDSTATGRDQMLLWNAPADGLYVITTDFPATAVDTVVYVLDNCVDGAPLACNDDAALATSSSRVVLDATAGAPYFIVVDSLGVGADYAIEIRPIDGTAGPGEPCSDTIVCDGDTLCTPSTDGFVCVGDEAPVLTDIDITWLDATTTRHVLRGTDVNQDVVNFAITQLVLESGDIYGDTADEGEIALTTPPDVVVDGDSFEIVFTVDWTAVPFVGELATSITAYVVDENGNESDELTVPYPDNVPPGTVGEGEECDLARRLNVCEAGFACTLQDGGPSICATPVAPTLTDLEMYRALNGNVTFVFVGEDPNQDVVTASFPEVIDSILGNIGPADFPFNDVEYDGAAYRGSIELILGAFDVTAVTVASVDATGLASGTITGNLADAIGPTELAEGDACVRGATDAVCGAGLACTPDAFGASTCQTAEAPVAISVEAVYQDETIDGIDIIIEGSDINADVVEIDVFVYDAEGGIGTLTLPAAAFTPSPNGRINFVVAGEVFAGGVFFTDLGIVLRDATGLESEQVIDPLGAEGSLGAPCSYDGVDGAFNTDEDLVCGTEGTCEVAAAPTLLSASGIRLDEDTMQFTFEGTDANGDVEAWLADLLDIEGTSLLVDAPIQLILDDSVLGLDAFTVTATITGFSDPGFAAVTDVTAMLIDTAGLTSEMLTIAIPPVIPADGACDPLGIDNVCADGTSCQEGVCTSAPPMLVAAAAIQNDDDVRLLEITFEGADADEDVTTITIDFLDDAGESLFGPNNFPVAGLGDPDGLTYADGAFTGQITLNWNGADVFGVDRFLITVTDSLGTESNEIDVTFRPTLGLDDTCDVEAIAGICTAGLTCDDVTLVCVVDTEAPCGPTELVDLAEVGTEVDGGIAWSYDTNGIANADAGTCGGGGGEIAVEYVAPTDGTLTVTTVREAGTTHDSLLYARRGLCLDTGAQAACNDDADSTLQSTITFPVVSGEVIYVFVDGFNAGGTGEVFFSLVSALVEGDACVGVEAGCGPGLLCNDASGTCVPEVEVGGACDTDLLTSVCTAGTDCVEGICVAQPGTCGAPVVLADAATFDAETATWTVDGDTTGAANSQAGSCALDGSPDFVYEFTAPADGTVTVDLTSPAAPDGFDTVLYVREAACDDAAAQIGCSDDNGSTRRSTVVLSVTSGETYYIFVDGFGTGSAGPYTLALSLVVTVGFGDICDDITAVCDTGLTCSEGFCTDLVVVGAGETCNGTTLVCDTGLSCEGDVCVERERGGTCAMPYDFNAVALYDAETNEWSYSGDALGATADQIGTCGGGGVEEVFAFTASIDGFMDVITVSTTDTVVYVREGECDGAFDELACNDDIAFGNTNSGAGRIPIVTGTTYFVIADTFVATEGDLYDLYIYEYQLALEGDACNDVSVFCDGDLVCFEETCAVVTEVADGEACNDISLVCAAGSACVAGLCSSVDSCIDALTVIPSDADSITASFADGIDTYFAPISCETGSEGSDELVFEWTADVTGTVQIDTAASTGALDTILWVSEALCGTATELACNDDIDFTADNYLSELTFDATTGTTYYFYVEEYNLLGGGETDGDVTITIARL